MNLKLLLRSQVLDLSFFCVFRALIMDSQFEGHPTKNISNVKANEATPVPINRGFVIKVKVPTNCKSFSNYVAWEVLSVIRVVNF